MLAHHGCPRCGGHGWDLAGSEPCRCVQPPEPEAEPQRLTEAEVARLERELAGILIRHRAPSPVYDAAALARAAGRGAVPSVESLRCRGLGSAATEVHAAIVAAAGGSRMKVVPESHVDHGLSPEVLEHVVVATMRHIRETGDDPRVVTHTLEVPPEIPGADRLLCGLHGPVMGDAPVPTGEGWYTERRGALLEAVAEASRTVLDEEPGAHATYSADDFRGALVRLAAALDDLDAYCPECDDAGVVPVVRHAGTSTCDPAMVDEVPCGCEASRVLAEQRRVPR